MTTLLDGKKVAESVYSKLLLELSLLPVVPRIVLVIVGDDPASHTYVKSKTKKCADLGLRSETLNLPATATESELLSLIKKLNDDKDVHGILVQLPVPKHINKLHVLQAIHPLKDVDGFHPENSGRLMQGDARLVPCTPLGIMEILKFYNIPIEGKHAVVVGRSEIVGKPAAQLLLAANATVTICHSKTVNLESFTTSADILVAAAGQRQFFGPSHVKPGSVIIDVGIHRHNDKLMGDVDFEKVAPLVSAITPVPGGVGPMTIAMLMRNLVTATALQSQK